MGFVRQSDLRALRRFLQDGDHVADADAFAHYVVEGVPRVVACDLAGYNEVDPARRRLVVIGKPDDVLSADLAETFGRFVDQHPLITHQLRTGNRSARKISDFLTRGQFHRLDLYRYGFKPIDAEYQVARGSTNDEVASQLGTVTPCVWPRADQLGIPYATGGGDVAYCAAC